MINKYKKIIVLILVTGIAIFTMVFLVGLYSEYKIRQIEIGNQGYISDETRENIQTAIYYFQTYHSKNLKFSLSFPKKMHLQGAGSCNGVAPIKVIESKERDKDIAYLTGEYYFNNADSGLCKKIIRTVETIKKEDTNSGFFDWKLIFAKISNELELNRFVKERYGKDCRAGKMKEKKDQPGVFEVDLIGTENSSGSLKDLGGGLFIKAGECFVNYQTVLLYSPSKQRAVSWNMGQAVVFIDGDYGVPVDADIAKSFRFE